MEERRYFTDNPVRYGQGTAVVVVVSMAILLLLPDSPFEARVWAIVNLALWAAVLLRTLRLGVYSSARGLRIYNLFKTYDVAWHEIEQITIGPTQWSGIAAVVEFTDGRRIHCSGVQHAWMSTVERAEEGACGAIVRQLNRDLERYTEEAGRVNREERTTDRRSRP